MKIAYTLLFCIINSFACKPICNIKTIMHNTHHILHELESQVTDNIKLMELEIKIAIMAQTILLQKQIDNYFDILSNKHIEQTLKYETMLESIGLSPAQEDEINKIIEMEKAIKKTTIIL